MSVFSARSLATRILCGIGRLALAPFLPKSKRSDSAGATYVEAALGIVVLAGVGAGVVLLIAPTTQVDNESRGQVSLAETAAFVTYTPCLLQEGMKPVRESIPNLEAEMIRVNDIISSEVPGGVGVANALFEVEQVDTNCSAAGDVNVIELLGYRNDLAGTVFDLAAIPANVFASNEITRARDLAIQYYLRTGCNGGVIKHYMAVYTYGRSGPPNSDFGEFNFVLTPGQCNIAAGIPFSYSYGGP